MNPKACFQATVRTLSLAAWSLHIGLEMELLQKKVQDYVFKAH